MRRFSIYGYGAIFAIAVFIAPLARAAEPKQFVAPQELTPEQLQKMKDDSKSNINHYGRDRPAKEEPFPWMATMLGVIVLAVVAPFGYRAFQSTAKELSPPRPERRTYDEE